MEIYYIVELDDSKNNNQSYPIIQITASRYDDFQIDVQFKKEIMIIIYFSFLKSLYI
jgi:hypothetical protein